MLATNSLRKTNVEVINEKSSEYNFSIHLARIRKLHTIHPSHEIK